MEDGHDVKRAGLVGDIHAGADDAFPGAHPAPAVGHLPVDVPASQADMQQHLDSATTAALHAQALGQDGITDAQAAAIAAAAAAAADGQQQQGQDAAGADVAAAAAAAAQLAALNAEQAQSNAVQAQLTAEQAQQQVEAMQAAQQMDAMQLAQQFNIDPTQAAALAAAGLPVSGALTLDPAQAAALQGLNLAQLAGVSGLTMDGQQLMLPDGLQLQAHEMYAHHGAEDMGMQMYESDLQRQQVESLRKADYQALAAAKRSGHLATIQFTLDLPAELADIELTERSGIIEVPVNGDVAMLKRLFQYQAHNKLLPALQTLITETGVEMMDAKEDGSPIPLAQYNIGNGSSIILKISVPDELDNVPLVDEALASAAYTTATGAGRTPSRKTRWTTEQIEALIEGVEKYGLSAWRTIVMDPRLASKNNMQCKDKFRNLCLTIIQGRPERGLTLPWQLKDRVRALIEQENIKERSWLSSGM
eukprot:GHUV01002472.1.p1 GENE.GHUV01002472.1~~GHUV01002472.1.p1  ORF type:complete len:476 (+),score=205.40 GHUV01002472.1:222-1649(+)